MDNNTSNISNNSSNLMERAALDLGIVSLLSFWDIYIAIPCAALGIIMGILSRGASMHFKSKAEIGIILCAIGLAICAALYGYVLYFAYEYFGGLSNMADYMNSIDSDTFYQNLYQNLYQ